MGTLYTKTGAEYPSPLRRTYPQLDRAQTKFVNRMISRVLLRDLAVAQVAVYRPRK